MSVDTFAARPSRPGIPLRGLLANGTVIVALIYLILFALYAGAQPTALKASGITSLANNAAPLAIAAAGETLVVLARGFDLSVAGVVSLSNVFMAAYPMEGPGGALLGLAGCIAIGCAVGAVNGFLVSVLKLQSIAATLGTMIMAQGLALVIMDAPGGTVADWVSYELTDTLFRTIPISSLVLLAVVGLWLLFRKTDVCLGIYAVGTDETAASLSGIPVQRVKFTAFMTAGALYGVAGFMLSAQTATGNPNAGTPFLMLTFAAVALGGVSLSGGKGSPIGAMIGAFTLMLLQKVLFSSGVSSFYTGIFQGAVMILAILFGSLVTRLSAEVRE